MWIAFKDFHGTVPRLINRPRELPIGYAKVARNCKLENGSIVAIGGMTYISTPAKTGTKRTIFLYKETTPDIWMHWLEDVNIARSLMEGDTTGLLAFTGDDYPKITDAAHATAGGGYTYPNTSHRLGVPTSAAPVATVTGAAPGENDDAEIETVSYRICYVATIGGVKQRGPLSDPSTAVDVSFGFGQSVVLTGIPTAPGGTYNPDVAKYIYRSTVGQTSAGWQFVAEIDVNASTYTDTTLTQNLSLDTADSEYFYAPPDDLINLQVMPNGILVGSSGNIICPSEPYQMHAFNPFNQKRVDFNIVAIAAFGQTAAILTDGQPYIYFGSTPSAMSLEKISVNRACVSKRGAVDFGWGVLYPAPNGIAKIGLGTADLATGDLFDKKTWANYYAPTTINAYTVEGWYVGFYYSGNTYAGFLFNPATMEFIDLDTYASAGFNDLSNDILYLMVDNNIVQWDEDYDNPLEIEYQTRPERTPYPCCMGWGQVIAADYPITFYLYDEDDNLIKQLTVTDADPFPIESGYMSGWFSVKVKSLYDIQWIGLGESPNDLMEAFASGEL